MCCNHRQHKAAPHAVHPLLSWVSWQAGKRKSSFCRTPAHAAEHCSSPAHTPGRQTQAWTSTQCPHTLMGAPSPQRTLSHGPCAGLTPGWHTAVLQAHAYYIRIAKAFCSRVHLEQVVAKLQVAQRAVFDARGGGRHQEVGGQLAQPVVGHIQGF